MPEPTPSERMATAEAEANAAQEALKEAQKAESRGREAISHVRVGLRENTTLPPAEIQRVTDAIFTGKASDVRIVALPPAPMHGGSVFENSTGSRERWALLGPDDELPPDATVVTDAARLFENAFEHVARVQGEAETFDEREAKLSLDLDDPEALTPLSRDDVAFYEALADEGSDRLERDVGIRLSEDFRKAIRTPIKSKSPQALADTTIALRRIVHPEDGREILVASVHKFGEAIPTGPGVRLASARRWLARLTETESICSKFGPDGGGYFADESGRSTRANRELECFRHASES